MKIKLKWLLQTSQGQVNKHVSHMHPNSCIVCFSRSWLEDRGVTQGLLFKELNLFSIKSINETGKCRSLSVLEFSWSSSYRQLHSERNGTCYLFLFEVLMYSEMLRTKTVADVIHRSK